MKTTLRKMGNSTGIIIPKPFLTELGLNNDVEMTIENNAIVIRKPSKETRIGWAQASAQLAAQEHDALQWPSFANRASEHISW